jgi:hypothetical protein
VTGEHPRDEFDDVVPLPGGRRGAHRAQPSRARALVPAGTAAAVAGAVVVTLALVGSPSTAPSATAASAPATAEGVPAQAPTGADALAVSPALAPADAELTSEEAGEEPSSSPSSEEPEPSPEELGTEPPAEPDTSVPLVVLNGTKTTGLAARAASALEGDGWTVSSTGNDRTGDGSTTTVAYSDAELEVTAAAVADALGAEAERDPAVADDVITVILGRDWSA